MKRSIKTAKIKGKKVIVRCDLDVPLKNGRVTDDLRLQKCIPTLRYLLQKGAKQIILIGHSGRPKGADLQFSLQPVQKQLEKLLKRKIKFVSYQSTIPQNKIVLLENLRFDEREKPLNLLFAKELAQLADIYVNNAFANSHRKHTSMTGIPKYIPGYIGLQVQEEMKQLSIVQKPKRPFVCVLGFAKITDKVAVLKRLLKKADYVLLGGAVVFTFLKAQGINTGKSLVEKEQVGLAKQLLRLYEKKIILPVDVVCASSLGAKTRKVVDITKIPAAAAGFDIGPESIKLFATYLKAAKTVFWNGPLGVFEVKPYDAATRKIAKIIAEQRCTSIIGGGDTAAAIQKTPYSFTHVSTGGGAALELVEGKKLPAIQIISG